MNSKERLTRLFGGQEIDRVPIWLLAPYHRLGCYADIYNNEYYKKIIPYIEKYCDTFDRRGYDFGFCNNANPDIKREAFTEEKDGDVFRGQKVSYKDFVLKSYISTGKSGTKLKSLSDDVDDLEKILEIPYIAGCPDISAYAREKEELGDKGIMMSDIGDPLTSLYSLFSAEDFSMLTLTDYDKILKFTDVIYERTLDNYRYLLDRDIGDVFFLVGAEFAGPPLVSPDKFNEISARYVKGIVDLIRSYGKKSIVHYHGNLYRVLDGMKTINPDGLHTIEAPPIGDCTITQARQALGKDMILIGNIQYDDLVRKTSAEIDEMVHDAIEEGKSGKFILSPTAGPYEAVLSDRTIENYIAFVEAGIKYGKL